MQTKYSNEINTFTYIVDIVQLVLYDYYLLVVKPVFNILNEANCL